MQAFVITAYKDYEALKTLTLALSRRGLCVIHADAQGAITARQVDELNALPNVRAIRKYKVNWGSVCHLYALLDLCRMALEDERVDYLHLMSAQDVPLLQAQAFEPLRGVLAHDPRPSYQSDPERLYGVAFAGKNVKFTVEDGVLTVRKIEEI